MRPKGESGGSGGSCETRVDVAVPGSIILQPRYPIIPLGSDPHPLVLSLSLSGKIHECGLISGTSFDVLVYVPTCASTYLHLRATRSTCTLRA